MRGSRFLILLCFGVLGALTGVSAAQGSSATLFFCFAGGCFFGVACLLLLSFPLHLFFRGVATRSGSTAIGDCLNTGFLTLLPFTLLALLAEVLLNWNATSAFVSTALMFSGGATANALAKADPEHPVGKLRALVPTLLAVLASLCWMVGWAVLLQLLGRFG